MMMCLSRVVGVPGGIRPRSVVLPMALLMIAACSSTRPLESQWPDEPVRIDGDASEWPELPTVIEARHLALGVLNDAESLYLSLVTTDRSLQAQILGQGLTLWLDPSGGKDRLVGLHYPEGIGEMRAMRMMGVEGPGMAGVWERMKRRMPDVTVLGPDGQARGRFPADSGGVRVALTMRSDTLTYEMRIPLGPEADALLATSLRPGMVLGLGFETPAPDTDRRPDAGQRAGRRGGGGRAGRRRGRAGRGSGRGGPRGGTRGAQRPDRPEPLDLWTRLTLVDVQ